MPTPNLRRMNMKRDTETASSANTRPQSSLTADSIPGGASHPHTSPSHAADTSKGTAPPLQTFAPQQATAGAAKPAGSEAYKADHQPDDVRRVSAADTDRDPQLGALYAYLQSHPDVHVDLVETGSDAAKPWGKGGEKLKGKVPASAEFHDKKGGESADFHLEQLRQIEGSRWSIRGVQMGATLEAAPQRLDELFAALDKPQVGGQAGGGFNDPQNIVERGVNKPFDRVPPADS